MLKVLTVVGARPQFIKCAVVSKELRQIAVEILVHTGQHYDALMNDVFFQQLHIPAPDVQLNVGSGTHGTQTARMLEGIENAIVSSRPDFCLVYGDTNSTLAGALAAAKVNVPVAHVEAGLRSRNRTMPEEINRVVADHVSAVLFAPTKTAVTNLRHEGITHNVHLVGDVMYDALLMMLDVAERESSILGELDLVKKRYYLATIHRAENVDDEHRLRGILRAFVDLATAEVPVVLPVHPRTKKRLRELDWLPPDKLRLLDPVSYIDMIQLENNARVVLTDSGGVQREAHWLDVPCVTLRGETEWPETLSGGANVLAGANTEAIVGAVAHHINNRHTSFVAHSCERASRLIATILCDYCK